jgi:DNA-3-methyladenine glycosylase
MGRIIKAKAWHNRRTVALARALLGKYLVRRRRNGMVDARVITEVEAYHGESDLASHARAGRTKRTEVMYGPGGVWYVYLCYGIHEMLNLVVGPPDHPAAVLIRGVEGLSGPGRLTRGLDIDRRLNGSPATPASGLWIEDRGASSRRRVIATPRIGVNYAGPVWAAKPWRFVLGPLPSKQPAGSRRKSRRP